ncbi:MAG: non-hydrolyzing UDP-N-acetylglucosamine 2-epimerase [Verrucomicrobiales bacterium]
MKVMTIVGTRPEVIRLSRVVERLRDVTNHVLVHTGQHYDFEFKDLLFNQLGLAPADISLNTASESTASSMANVIAQADRVLGEERPDALLVLGDTTSCLAAIPAQRRGIPVFHMEAGNRCFDRRVPEELNRKIVDHVSDVNLCYSEQSRTNLLREGLSPDLVIKTGSPLKEVLEYYAPKIAVSTILVDLGLNPGEYFVASLHRQELVDSPESLMCVLQGITDLAKDYQRPVVFPIHPRTRQRLEEVGWEWNSHVRLHPPLGFFEFVTLQRNALCVLTDSGSISEESSILGFPAVTLRDTHERAEAMDEASVVLAGYSPDRLRQAVDLTIAQFKHYGPLAMPTDYSGEAVSWKVAKIILSYTDYVRSRVWRGSLPAV